MQKLNDNELKKQKIQVTEEKILGYKTDEMIGKEAVFFMPPDEKAHVRYHSFY